MRPHLLLSYVDSCKARAVVQQGMERYEGLFYHLDLGNTRDGGQGVLGCPLGTYNPRKRNRLRTAYELFSELVDTTLPEDDAPSCSPVEALERQDLFVNDMLVTSALNLLWRRLRYGELT